MINVVSTCRLCVCVRAHMLSCLSRLIQHHLHWIKITYKCIACCLDSSSSSSFRYDDCKMWCVHINMTWSSLIWAPFSFAIPFSIGIGFVAHVSGSKWCFSSFSFSLASWRFAIMHSLAPDISMWLGEEEHKPHAAQHRWRTKNSWFIKV